MLKIREAIVVEGQYDKIKLGQLVDTVIVTTDGFRIYKNAKKIALIRKLAKKDGIIILTDSDRAGFQIRNYVRNLVGDAYVKHAYIPDVPGKEKRKRTPSKEGFLGVEGIEDAQILRALEAAGCTGGLDSGGRSITKADLFADGLSGTAESAQRRDFLSKKLGLPRRLSANMLLDVLNRLYGYESYRALIDTIDWGKEIG